MSTTSVLYISLQPLSKKITAVVHLLFIGAICHVVWAQWWFGWQLISLMGLGWGYRQGLRRYVWLTDCQSIQAITLTAECLQLHLPQRVRIQCRMILPAIILSWGIVLTYQTSPRHTKRTLFLLRHHMDAEAWRRLKVRLLYSSV